MGESGCGAARRVDSVGVVVPARAGLTASGTAGAGKSTLLALLERLYRPTAGAITLDGHDIATLNVQWLRQRIGFVSQVWRPALGVCQAG